MDEYLLGMVREADLLKDGRAWPNYHKCELKQPFAQYCGGTMESISRLAWSRDCPMHAVSTVN